MGAAIHEIHGEYGVDMKVAALISGDGVDLVVHPVGRRSRTVQITCDEARALAAALIAAADESPTLTINS